MSFIHQKKVKQRLRRFLTFAFILYVMINTSLYLLQDKILFRPTVLDQEYQFEFANKFEEVFLKTDEAAIINAIHFKVENPKGVILYFHGNQGDLQRWGKITEYFVDKDYDVFVMDYRTYGKSIGTLNENVLYSDADYMYNHIKKQYKESEIIVYGRSLGTTFATFVASKHNPKQLILETPYYSMIDVAQNRFPLIPVKQFMNYEFPTFSFIDDVDCNIIILHGTSDKIVPFLSGQKLFQVAPKPSTKFISIDGASHNNLINFEAYHREIDAIL
ncbi:MAG: alpha/beta hydrolase [Bacteroidetes bacterium]|nr:MAG: alpha/beta hydrolase [Bacteroidota bacterium]